MEYITPNFGSGYARNSGEALYPNLWRNLWGYWSPSMGEQGSYLYDFSGKQGLCSFTTTNPPTWVNSPAFKGPAIQFPSGMATNGSCKGVILNAPDSYFPKSNFGYTFSCWFNVPSGHSGKIQFLLISGSNGLDSAGDIYLFYNDGSSQFNLGGVFNSSSEWDFSPTGFTTSTIYDGKWHLFTLVCDPLGSTTTAYLDARVIGTTSGSFQYTQGSPQQVWLGSPGNVGSGPWTCSDAGIWYRALSKDEVGLLYQGVSPLQFRNPDGWLWNPELENPNISVSTLSLTASLLSPSLNLNDIISPSNFSLTASLLSPTVTSETIVNPTHFSLSASLLSPSLTISTTINPAPLSLTAILKAPVVTATGNNTISNASKIISYNPLVIVSNTNPVKLSIVNISSPDTPVYTTYTYAGATFAKDLTYNAELNNFYVACANGIIIQIDASSPTSYSLISTGTSANLLAIDTLTEFFDIYAGTNFSTGEALSMYQGSAVQLSTDVRFSQLVSTVLSLNINTLNAASLNTDMQWSQTIDDVFGCDVRFIAEDFADLSITPIARPDFHVYINNIEVTDVQLESIEITHTADEKSSATFVLARKHDQINFMLDGTSSPITGNPSVKIIINGNQEFGYNSPAFIWDIDAKSENEHVQIVAYSELPQQDERSSIDLSLPSVNEKLHVYHALINNPEINDAFVLADDINPPYYLGIQIDPGYYKRQNIIRNIIIQNVQTVAQSVTDGTFKPQQNWTYFWFASAINFVTGRRCGADFELQYIGTSPTSLTADSWEVTGLNYFYQREFPSVSSNGTLIRLGTATVYPSDFIGILTPAQMGLVDILPWGGFTTIDAMLRNHTPAVFTGQEVLLLKESLARQANNSPRGSFNLTRDLSTKALDLIDSKLGIFFGSAPYKKVSATSGVYITTGKFEDKPDGVYLHKDEGYNYTDYVNLVGGLELQKLENINGTILPKTKCDIETFIDGYYHYNIALLKRINIDNTTTPSIYNGNNGFPVSVKSIHISAKTMRVTLSCTNAWSRLELLEIEGRMPDPNQYITPETLALNFFKFDPNAQQFIQ